MTSTPDDSKTIIDYFFDNVEKLGDRCFLTQPMGGDNKTVQQWSFHQVLDESQRMAAYLESLKLPPKSHIAILSKNCSWWVLADLAIIMAGHVSVPVYPSLTAETTNFILKHSESKLLFIGKLDYRSWEAAKAGIPEDIHTVSFPISPENCAQVTWADIIAKHTPIQSPVKRSPDEMCTIIYTSGTTGMPKGVMTSFKAMLIPTMCIAKVLHCTSDDRYLSYLPVAHGMERWLGECLPLYTGEYLFFADSIKSFVDDLNRCRPTLFLSVPRLWTKFQAGIFAKIPDTKLRMLLRIPILSFFLKRKILRGLGLDCVRFAGSGSAPIPESLLHWYGNLGLQVLEGYGMTETFNFSHLNQPGKTRVGYVGNTYDGVEHRIAHDGEIQVKTPGMMMGYFKNEDANQEAMTDDGWVRTGDTGEIDDEGRLKITGRIKEIFKTSKGKYVAPSPIENLWVAHHLVELACVGGQGYPQPHAILQLSDVAKADICRSDDERLKIAKALENYMDVVNQKLDGHEHLAFVVIVKEDWLPENGLLTPTQKIKRAAIENAYAPHVDGWYSQKTKVVWHGW